MTASRQIQSTAPRCANGKDAPISDLPAPARNPERGDSILSGRITARSAAIFQSVNQLRQLAEAKTA
jgi:hypothetical protein